MLKSNHYDYPVILRISGQYHNINDSKYLTWHCMLSDFEPFEESLTMRCYFLRNQKLEPTPLCLRRKLHTQVTNKNLVSKKIHILCFCLRKTIQYVSFQKPVAVLWSCARNPHKLNETTWKNMKKYEKHCHLTGNLIFHLVFQCSSSLFQFNPSSPLQPCHKPCRHAMPPLWVSWQHSVVPQSTRGSLISPGCAPARSKAEGAEGISKQEAAFRSSLN